MGELKEGLGWRAYISEELAVSFAGGLLAVDQDVPVIVLGERRLHTYQCKSHASLKHATSGVDAQDKERGVHFYTNSTHPCIFLGVQSSLFSVSVRLLF